MPPFSFILACLAFTAALIWAEYRGDARVRWIAKPAASACFILVALMAGALDSVYGQWVLTALVLCAAGDVLLIPENDKTFLAGMGAFALGHAAYVASFLSGAPAIGPAFLSALLGMGVFALLVLRWLWPHLGGFRWPVAGYAAIISAMVATSVLAAPPGASGMNIPVIAGAAGFAISDLSVARDKFVTSEFFNRLWGLPLYYGAQLLLAASV